MSLTSAHDLKGLRLHVKQHVPLGPRVRVRRVRGLACRTNACCGQDSKVNSLAVDWLCHKLCEGIGLQNMGDGRCAGKARYRYPF